MRPRHHIPDRDQVHRLAAEHPQAHLEFKDDKRKVTANAFPTAAARITSMSDACLTPKEFVEIVENHQDYLYA